MIEFSKRYRSEDTRGKESAVIFDIDQVLADIDHRLPFITEQNPKDWDSFYSACVNDKPIYHTVKLLSLIMRDGTHVFFVTGRREEIRKETIDWLHALVFLSKEYIDEHLFMRPLKDKREDVQIKKEIFDNHIKGKYFVLCVFEDRKSCVQMWREQGLLCLQNEFGDF